MSSSRRFRIDQARRPDLSRIYRHSLNTAVGGAVRKSIQNGTQTSSRFDRKVSARRQISLDFSLAVSHDRRSSHNSRVKPTK